MKQEERVSLIVEMNKMRIRLTQIYMKFGNPSNCDADMRLSRDICLFESGSEINE